MAHFAGTDIMIGFTGLRADRWGRKEYVIHLDQSIHSALGLSHKWKLLSDEEYATIDTSPQFPVKVMEKD